MLHCYLFFHLLLFIALITGCAGGSVKKPDKTDTAFLERRVQLLKRGFARIRNFTAVGFFNYKDSKTEINMSVRIVRDQDRELYRISFRGNLDDALWADILVLKGRVSLYFPLQKTLYTAKLKGFDLYPFTKIHVQLEELLQLAGLRPYLFSDASPVQSTLSRGGFVLYRERPGIQQKVFLDSAHLRITAVHLFEKTRFRAGLSYSLYKKVALSGKSIELPFKSTLTVPVAGVRALLWLKRIQAGGVSRPEDALLRVGPGTELRRM